MHVATEWEGLGCVLGYTIRSNGIGVVNRMDDWENRPEHEDRCRLDDEKQQSNVILGRG